MKQYPVIDLHSHILPQIDDGSKNMETTIAMLREMKQQGVDICVATPHYYCHHRSVASFLERRNNAWNALQGYLDDSMPKILLGAEVAASDRLLKTADIERLCIGRTNVLLLEMPFSQWTYDDLEMVTTLSLDRGFTILLAHLERFYPLQDDIEIFERILALPLYAQVNADSLIGFRERRAAFRLFKNGYAQVMGSDAHNMRERAPHLGKGRASLEKHMGRAMLEKVDRTAYSLIFPGAVE